MKEIHDQSFGPVTSSLLCKIYGYFFIVGIILTAILRAFFLGSDASFGIFVVVILITSILILIAHRPQKVRTKE